MGTVIYSVGPLQAFFGQLVTILILLLIGAFGVGMSVIRTKQSTISRIVLALAGVVLLLAGGLTAFLVYREITGDAKTVTVLVEDKQIVESNCNDGDTCISYLVETSATPKFYDFTVPEDAYEQIQVRACYEFTYYPQRGLLAPAYDTEFYEAASTITRILVADAADCVQP